jgi:multiple sugar transport system ATP-binding protein
VDTIEPLGSEKLLHLIGGGTEFVARVDPRFPAAIGDQLSLAFDPKRAHLFDAQSGVRLQQLTKAVPA